MAHAEGGEIATKRVALTPSTWATLSQLRKPGQTFDGTIAELITDHQRWKPSLILMISTQLRNDHVDRAKKDLGLT